MLKGAACSERRNERRRLSVHVASGENWHVRWQRLRTRLPTAPTAVHAPASSASSHELYGVNGMPLGVRRSKQLPHPSNG